MNTQASQIPCHVLGYGEISTVLEIDVEDVHDLAFKRMCLFENIEEARSYLAHYIEYNRRLESEIGLNLPPYGYALLVCETGRPVFYIIQKRLPPASIGNQAIYWLAPQEITLLLSRPGELHKVWLYNRSHPDHQVGIDGQISNWAIAGLIPGIPAWRRQPPCTTWIPATDLSSGGVEQLGPEPFPRPPPYLVWILRLLFVKDVMTRYYDPRKVTIDLLANFYKEQRAELIPTWWPRRTITSRPKGPAWGRSIRSKEVSNYYREDQVIWSLYLSFRRFDRFLRVKVLHREYPYILPGKIKR
jgi:hypothetical protein